MKHIENWCMYGVHSLNISLTKYGEEDYSPQITIILDDGSERDDMDSMKVITLMLKKSYKNPKDAIYETINGELLYLFEKISSEIIVLNESNEIVENYDYNVDFDEYKRQNEMDEEIHMAMMIKSLKKPTIH